jgi:hypothetical protein
MAEYEQIFHKQELYDLYSKGEIVALDDLYGIEDIGLNIQEMNKKIEFLKEYKRRKRSDIDKEIEIMENKIDFFKKIVITTLKEKKEKGVDFPGSCKAVSRNNKATWNITNEEEFKKIVKKAKEEGEKVEDSLKETVVIDIVKKNASKLLDIWEKNGNFEKYFEVGEDEKPCVKKEPSKTTVSFRYPEKIEDEDMIDETAIPTKESVKINEFDGI